MELATYHHSTIKASICSIRIYSEICNVFGYTESTHVHTSPRHTRHLCSLTCRVWTSPCHPRAPRRAHRGGRTSFGDVRYGGSAHLSHTPGHERDSLWPRGPRVVSAWVSTEYYDVLLSYSPTDECEISSDRYRNYRTRTSGKANADRRSGDALWPRSQDRQNASRDRGACRYPTHPGRAGDRR